MRIVTIMSTDDTDREPLFRMTRQRQVILDALRGLRSHPTADELYERVRRELPRISLGTIYRNLEILSESGLIQRLDLGGAQRRFDGDLTPHYHVRCTRCGQVDDVMMPAPTGLDETAARASDYQIAGHRLEFVGLCPRCSSVSPDVRRAAQEDTTTHTSEPTPGPTDTG